MRASDHRADGDWVVDAVKGAIAGAVATWAMDRVAWYLYDREDPAALRREERARVGGLDVAHVAANKLAGAGGVTLSPPQPHPAGLAVHYSFGIVPGAIYGVLRRRVPEVSAGRGLAYGLGIFLLLDQVAAVVLGLASRPDAYPWQAHARGLVSHAALGVATETTLEALDRVA